MNSIDSIEFYFGLLPSELIVELFRFLPKSDANKFTDTFGYSNLYERFVNNVRLGLHPPEGLFTKLSSDGICIKDEFRSLDGLIIQGTINDQNLNIKDLKLILDRLDYMAVYHYTMSCYTRDRYYKTYDVVFGIPGEYIYINLYIIDRINYFVVACRSTNWCDVWNKLHNIDKRIMLGCSGVPMKNE